MQSQNPTKHLYNNKYKSDTIRLKNWDYSRGAFYFITICTKNKQNFFGKIEEDSMKLNSFGKIVEKFWFEISEHFENVRLNEFVVMPNHVHGILVLEDALDDKLKNGAENKTQQCCVSTDDTGEQKSNTFYKLKPASIPVIIRSYKSICTKTINSGQDYICFAWQARYYERIIRNNKEFLNIQQYIIDNPKNWEEDENYK